MSRTMRGVSRLPLVTRNSQPADSFRHCKLETGNWKLARSAPAI
jgi:hypothetical protein